MGESTGFAWISRLVEGFARRAGKKNGFACNAPVAWSLRLRHKIGRAMAPAPVDTTIPSTKPCVSCGAPLCGPYCSRCGERVLEPEALTLRHFLVHTVAHELLHLDGALWRTLRVLFVRPGRLSLEYAAGRRRPYLNPFRLLLIAIIAYALMTALGNFGVTLNFGPVTVSMAPPAPQRSRAVNDTIAEVDKYGLLRRHMAAKQEQLRTEEARERFHDRLDAFVQPASFANVILLAAALHLAFRWKRRCFLEHAAFSIHVVTFVLLSSLLLFVAMRLRHWLPINFYLTIVLFALWQFSYLAVAIRRFYLTAGGWGNRVLSVAAAMLLYILNTVFITGVQVAGAAIALALT